MTNSCYNEITFQGDTAAAKQAYAVFDDLASGKFRLPEFGGIDRETFRDLSLEQNQRFCYLSRSNPNLDLITAFAGHFGADHRHYYIESKTGLCGEVVSRNGIAEHTRLIPDDLSLVRYDAACEQFEFRSHTGDDPYELWPIMLEEKQKALDRDDVRRRLSGELPHILLGPDDYLIDLSNRTFIKANEPGHRIDMARMLLNSNEAAYVMHYYLPAQQAVPPPRDHRECPDNVWLLEIPLDRELDPIAFARLNGDPDADHLLACPYQSYRCANAYSAAEYQALQNPRGRGR